ncbi:MULTISPECIES: ABC transporter permease [Idiomarina]|uniref:ABC transporter permease n=1 Tax=Idiomarina TaxID=135575 RepID=UPI00129C42DA|nr:MULTISPECIES: ABC transporter permease [Idiomarina]MDX1526090.1 ABC transporter permease [Pseudidiomarina maritima]MRJ43150.1 ABC transporter permease [Idiomarina sp. FeN1]NCU57162.1 ABC transporter permease [Idiomarina sp. FenA--70]NCU59871.1 ABC transporter permease [Idiomarina sp. FenBw--71]UUN13142.1 ABC transporter permease [Idiomarina loihiensis]
MFNANLYVKEAGYDLLSLWRTPAFFLPAILFPVTFYIFFGIVFNFSSGSSKYMLVSYACFGMMGPAMFNYATAVASDRAHGWLTLKRVAPMPFNAYVAAKYVSSLVFALCIALILFVTGGLFAGVELYTWQWLALLLVLLIGTLPFALIGLLLGLCLSDKSAPAVVNLVYLPMAFLSGLWVPIQFLPEAVQYIAYGLPAYHYAQLAHAVIGTSQGHSIWLHLAALVGFSLLLVLLVRWRYQRLSH